jgi:DNA adenine methylase
VLTYQVVKDSPEELFMALKKLKNTAADYYSIRSRNCKNAITKSARFIYLNQTSYNGLWRVNRHGGYNVPYGFRSSWTYEKSRLMAASQFLTKQQASILCQDFESSIAQVQQDDLVFLDPPYTVSQDGRNGFIEYNETIFSLDDQKRLSTCIETIKNRHAYYILTNAYHPIISEIFDKGDTVLEVFRHSCIGGKSAKRGPIKEYVFTNIPGVATK